MINWPFHYKKLHQTVITYLGNYIVTAFKFRHNVISRSFTVYLFDFKFKNNVQGNRHDKEFNKSLLNIADHKS